MIKYRKLQFFRGKTVITASVLILAFIVIVIINTIYSHFYKVVNMPSTPQTRNKIINILCENHDDCAGLSIYDLGSGWGGLCRKLSSKFPRATIKGFEISPVPYMVSKIFALFGHYTISRQDIFKLDLSQADIIVCYLSHYHMNKLANKIKNECRPGLILYSQGFPIKDMIADKIIDIPYSIEGKLYQYNF